MKKKSNQQQQPAPGDEELRAGSETDQRNEGRDDYDPVEHIAQLEQERDEAVDKYKRSLADFQNFQRRSIQSEQQAREQAVAGVVQSLLPVMDHFQLALEQDLSQTNVEQFAQGMRIVRDELHKALQMHGLSRIEVKVGEPFDPKLHDAVAHVPGEGVEAGHVSNVTQQGYRLGERVLRAAKVTVAPAVETQAEPEESQDDDRDIASEDQD